jgi:hypothetical protein
MIKFNRKFYLMIFIFILILVVVENPMFQPLNLVVQSSQLTASNPNINNGLSLQGSCLINENIKNVQAYNSTGNIVNAYQVNTTVFNFMSLMLIISPIALYIYFEYNKKSIEKPIIKKRVKRKIE